MTFFVWAVAPVTPCSPFCWHKLTFIPAWISIYIYYVVWDETTYPFLNFNVAPLKFRNGYIISPHTLLGLCEYIVDVNISIISIIVNHDSHTFNKNIHVWCMYTIKCFSEFYLFRALLNYESHPVTHNAREWTQCNLPFNVSSFVGSSRVKRSD